ncbi:MAG: hypothetical protein M3Y58_02110 [Chloroflexota bacterium]|nr:hypothetical protein [Chloroflexota bacterium]
MSSHKWFRPMGRAGFALLLIALLIPIWPLASVRAAQIVVSNTNDTGSGSLYDAIVQADAGAGGATIIFAIPGAGVQTIAPHVLVPNITKPVTIGATTQPGYAGSPLIQYNGANAGGVSAGFTLTGGGITIKGFAINGWYNAPGAGINILSNGNVVQANYIGTDPTGGASVANGTGIYIATASNNLIGGTVAAARNIISGNNGIGISIDGTVGGTPTGNIIQGNYIGLNAAGTALVQNPTITGSNKAGVDIAAASGNTVGGTAPGAGNVISGNAFNNADVGAGVTIERRSTNNTVQGNYIGTDATGTRAILNNAGVYIDTSSGNLVGGTTAAARNVVSGNRTIGVTIDGSGDASGNAATSNTIQGNFIGTDVSGTAAIPNNAGISITSANNNTVGGTAAGATNLISGNTNSGVVIEGFSDHDSSCATAASNAIQGNLIGTNAAGTAALGNATGIAINGGSATTVGGATATARNVIAGFSNTGVLVSSYNPTVCGHDATGNLVQGNFIGTDSSGVNNLNNGQGSGVGFDTADNNSVAGNTIAYTYRGVLVATAFGDSVLGNAIFTIAFRAIDLQGGTGNNNQATPALTGETSAPSHQITVTGSLSNNGVAPYRIEFFSTPNALPEGKVFLGFTMSNGGPFSATIPAAPAGQYITATATDTRGDTSPFSNPVIVTAGPPTNVTPNPGTTPQSVVAGNAFNPLAVTVRDANGNPVSAGILVTFTAPNSGPSGTFSNGQTTIQVRTDANGVASAPFTSNLIGGTYQVMASVAGVSPAIFVLTNAPRPVPVPRPGPPPQGPPPNAAPSSRGGPVIQGQQPPPAPMGR